MNSGKILLGVLAGAAAGALLGILFAPEKGAVTRKNVTDKGDDYAEGLKEKFNAFLEELNSKADKVQSKVTEFSENGR